MDDQVGKLYHPQYKGFAEWEVKAVARIPEPIAYNDPVLRQVS